MDVSENLENVIKTVKFALQPYISPMKKLLLLLLSLLSVLPSVSQVYEADYIIGNFICAYYVGDDGQLMMRRIPNGTLIDVTGRTVRGDSADCRSIMAEFRYDGKDFMTEARWLNFSEHNPEGTVDMFANDNFSRTPEFVSSRLAFTRVSPLSRQGRMLYSLGVPVLQIVLMLLACWLLLRKNRLWVSSLPFVAAVAVQSYASLCMGDDYLWYCLPEYQGIGGAIVGFIPLALFFFMECAYLVTVWVYSRPGVSIWPVVAGWFLLYPSIVIGWLLGSVWVGAAIVVMFPLLVNGVRCGRLGVAETVLLEIGMIGVAASFAAVFMAGWQIVAAVIGVYFVAIVSVFSGIGLVSPAMKGVITALPGGRYAVGAQSFSTRAEAESHLKQMRAAERARAIREQQRNAERERDRFNRQNNPW